MSAPAAPRAPPPPRPPRAPEFGAAIDTGFITDLGSIAGENGNRMLILLDIERLIAAADVGLVG